MGLGVRVATPMSEKSGGGLVDSEGRSGAKLSGATPQAGVIIGARNMIVPLGLQFLPPKQLSPIMDAREKLRVSSSQPIWPQGNGKRKKKPVGSSS